MGDDSAASGEDGEEIHVKETELLRLVLDWLAAKHIFAIRMNTGAVKITSETRDDQPLKGKERFFRFGVPGMADILAFPHDPPVLNSIQHIYPITPLWIELKVGKNGQSDLQKSFQKQVEREGHMYILCRSLEELEAHF